MEHASKCSATTVVSKYVQRTTLVQIQAQLLPKKHNEHELCESVDPKQIDLDSQRLLHG